MLRQQVKERKAIADAELEHLRAKEWRAYEQCNAEFRKQERYCKEQRDVLRALEDLKEQERTMYEIDHRKDQVMTVCKVALANLAMWVRDHYFPPSYAQATWKRLLPFFQLPGTITQDATLVQVDRVLRHFPSAHLDHYPCSHLALCKHCLGAPKPPESKRSRPSLMAEISDSS